MISLRILVTAVFLAAVMKDKCCSKVAKSIIVGSHSIPKKTDKSWTSGVTSLSGKPFEYLQGLAGTILDYKNADKEPFVLPTAFHNRITLPDSFDARERWPNCRSIGRIYEQGRCGSCWAVAGTTAISDRICIAIKQQDLDIPISPQDALLCSGGTQSLCQGGYTKSPYVMYVQTGIVSGGPYRSGQGCLPYAAFTKAEAEATNTTCPNACSNPKYSKPYVKDKFYGSNWYAMGNQFANKVTGIPATKIKESILRQIQYELMTNGPVTVAINLYEDFVNYKSGVYRQQSGKLLGGHALRLLGWGTERGLDYWLVANSWGVKWGMDGLIKIVRGENHLGIEDYIATGTPQPENQSVFPLNSLDVIPCDSGTVSKCAGKYGYSIHPVRVCTNEWCFCGWDKPEVVQCPEGQSFNADPSVYNCADTATVPACQQ